MQAGHGEYLAPSRLVDGPRTGRRRKVRSAGGDAYDYSRLRIENGSCDGHRDPGHPDAIAADAGKPFHHQSAFVRFRPYAMSGRLPGRNPLPDRALTIAG